MKWKNFLPRLDSNWRFYLVWKRTCSKFAFCYSIYRGTYCCLINSLVLWSKHVFILFYDSFNWNFFIRCIYLYQYFYFFTVFWSLCFTNFYPYCILRKRKAWAYQSVILLFIFHIIWFFVTVIAHFKFLWSKSNYVFGECTSAIQ